MTYAEAVARLLALRGGEHAGMRPGLERIETLLEALGNPERRSTLVQVAGTNGKGSVAAMLAAILKADGRRVGLYTSPHLVSFRERIRVDGEAIAEDDVADGFDAIATLVARLDATMFEASTALALDHFAREAVDVAVLEVGLGGRLDATTVGAPAVIALAADVSVPLLMEGRELSVRVRERGLAAQIIDCAGPDWRLEGLRLPLLGVYQPSNALVALAAARALGVRDAACREGLARARWPGRFEVLRAPDRIVVLDGAHNPAGAGALAASLAEWFGDTPLTLVFGALRDKDARGMLAALAPRARRLILTASSSPRAARPEALRAVVPAGVAVELADSAAEALALAAREPRTPILCVAGSLSLLGDVLRVTAGDKPCPLEKAADSVDSLI